jgi:hypothetical protein
MALAALGVALGSASLSAQQVPYTAPGTTSLTGVPMIYNGQYAIQKTDFGFFWLDTAALHAGLVQVESKCGVGQPPAVTGLYVLGDCNGISQVSSSGDIVMARQYSGQCGAATDGCGGPRDPDGGTGMFAFRLGTWEYLGRDLPDIPNSTQTADLLGRTWVVQALDGNGRNFLWVSAGNPNAPPLASATATNLSAIGRIDKTNYYGDRWQLQDTSVSTLAITRIDWDFLYKTFFSLDEVGAPATEASVVGYFPCDPSGTATGAIRTGANCMQSLGLTNPAAPNSYRFAMQSANTNGTSTTPFLSAPIPVVCPQANILGYTGFSGTCAKTAGRLNILSGGNADASASQGNLVEASVNWSFTGQNPISVQGPVVPVPSGATGFTLTITYPGGYKATAQGSIAQASLVPAFSLVPDPVLLNTSVTLTNQMQLANATLNSVNSVITQGACDSSFNAFGSAPQLPGSFLPVGGSASLQAPAAVGGYCVNLKYNFTPQGQPQQSQIVSSPFSAMNWSASPQIGISPVPFCTSSCQLQAGTAYSLFDAELITVSPHPAAQWDLNGAPIGNSSDANAPISWTPTSACSSCTVRVTVNGFVATLPVTVSGAVPPTPTPTPTSTPTPTNTPPPTNTPTPTNTPPPTNTPTPTNTRTPTNTPNVTATPTPPPPPPPSATTNPASAIAQTIMTLKGTVNPNGTATSVSFEYGTTTSYGSTTAPQSIGAGSNPVAVSQTVAGLICGTPYHFRVVATTSSTTTRGLDQTFTTDTCTSASFSTVQPCRLLDTRNPTGPSGGPALSAGVPRTFPVTGLCNIPSTAKSVAINLAVVSPGDTGDIRLYPAGAMPPAASAINFHPGAIRSSNTVMLLGVSGQMSALLDMPPGSVATTHFVVDVYGYFQ